MPHPRSAGIATMDRLADILLKEGVRDRLVAEMARAIGQEIQERRGLMGSAIRGGFRFVSNMRHDFVYVALDDMLEAFVEELDPLYAEHGSPEGFGDYLIANRDRVAHGMLRVSQARRQAIRSAAIRQAYDRLQPFARSNVERAVPRLGRVIQGFVDEPNPQFALTPA
jgi:hypothetical protein